jgi:hypothetical protein
MKKSLIIITTIVTIVGLCLMYAGYNMAQGMFWGTAYYPGDYTTFIVGCIFAVIGSFSLAGTGIYFHQSKESGDFEQKIIRNNASGCVPRLLRVISLFIALVGILMIILGFFQETAFIFEGLGVLLSSILIYGISYIIHAAIIYINKQRNI